MFSACNKEATTAEILSEQLALKTNGRRTMPDISGTNLEDVISVLVDGNIFNIFFIEFGANEY